MTSILAMGHPYQRDKSPLQEKVANVLLNIKKAWSRFACSPRLRATTPFSTISTNDPRPRWDVSVRLIPVEFESGSFSRENKRRISKIPVAPHHSVRGYVSCNIDYSERMEVPSQARHDNLRGEVVRNCPTLYTGLFSRRRRVPFACCVS